MTHSRNLRLLAIAGLLIITFAVYAQGLNGGFEFDDEPNIVRNEKLLITELSFSSLKQAAFSMQSGQLMRPVSYLTFAVNHYLTGLDPWHFKLTNLLIHLLNGLAVYWLSHQLLSAYANRYQPALNRYHIAWISLTASGFWLLHPLNLTSVLYVVQRMNSLSALFVFLGLATYCWGRNRQIEGRSGWPALAAAVLLFLPLAVLSKENGALLPLLMLGVEITLFRFSAAEDGSRRLLYAFFAVTAILPAVLVSGYLLTHIDWWLSSYDGRDFTLSERILTQSRVIWFYLVGTVAPNISQLGLFHDDFPLSSGLLKPPTTGLAIVGLLGLLACAWLCRQRAPLISLGLVFFLVGHSMESSIFALEMVHEHRNYLPMYGILLPLAYYLLHPALPAKTAKARSILGVVFICILGITTAIRANDWGNPLQLALSEARNHPASARSQYRLGKVYWHLANIQPQYADKYTTLARENFERARTIKPSDTSGLFALITLDARQGVPLKEEQLADLEQRLHNFPFSSASYNQLRELVKCLVEGLCRIAPQNMDRIVQTSLENPHLNNITRSRLLAEAVVVALLRDDQALAMKLGEEATRANPNDPQHWLNYASLLIQAGKPEPARTILLRLREDDLPPLIESRLEVQEKALQDMERKTQ